MENNKSQAEIYREERKARLAKEAEKKAKRSPKFSRKKKILGKIIAIVLAVAIALGAIGGILNFFGVPQKVIKISVDNKDCSFTVAEFNFFYINAWSNICTTAQQYTAYYGIDLGFDYSKSPAKQEYVHNDTTGAIIGINAVEDLGVENPTWADVIRYSATSQLVYIKYYASLAREAGLELSEEDKNLIDSEVESYRETAKQNDYSLDRWLRTQLGNGIDENVFRKVYEDATLADKYAEKLEADTSAAITDADIDARYESEKKNFDNVDIRLYQFSTKTPTLSDDATEEQKTEALNKAKEETKANAEKFLAAVTDEKSFIEQAKNAILTADNKSTTDPDKSTLYDLATYAELEGLGEETTTWVFDAARKEGDKAVFDCGDGYYAVIYMLKPAYRDTGAVSHSVRHILVSFPEVATGEELTAAQKNETRAKAQAILDEYLQNPTEENFAALATAKTEDTGSAETGGLYEDLTSSTNFVQPFKDWYLDSSRKVGDTGIIESTYGYHVMYYSKANGVAWYDAVKTTILNEKLTSFYETNVTALLKTINANSLVLKWAVSAEAKHIEKLIAYSSATV